mmetsp:Transcript_13430/g.50313  ORF Transcript_13430/g.50313 Transcript_13430/m.50313 type:complete len:534 (+) Transcript_13430:2877-4478(+)
MNSSAVACSGASDTSSVPISPARFSISSSKISNTNASSTAPSLMAIKSTLSRKFLNALKRTSTSSRWVSVKMSLGATPEDSFPEEESSSLPLDEVPAFAKSNFSRSVSTRARSRSCCAAVSLPRVWFCSFVVSLKSCSRASHPFDPPLKPSSPRNAKNASRCAAAPATDQPFLSKPASASTNRRSETPPFRNERVAFAKGATFLAMYFFPAFRRCVSPPRNHPQALAGHFMDVTGARSKYGALYPLNHSFAQRAFRFPAPTSSEAASRVKPLCFQSSSQYSCTARRCSMASKEARTRAAASAASSRSRICSHQCWSGVDSCIAGVDSFCSRINRNVSGSRTAPNRRTCAPSSSKPQIASRALARCAKDIASARSFTKTASPRIACAACGSPLLEVASRSEADMPPAMAASLEMPVPPECVAAPEPAPPPSKPPDGNTPLALPNPRSVGGTTYVRCHGFCWNGECVVAPLTAFRSLPCGAVYGSRGALTITTGGGFFPSPTLKPSCSPSALIRLATAKCSSRPSHPGSTPARVT